MKTSRMKFSRGQRVTMTRIGVFALKKRWQKDDIKNGIVVGFCRSDSLVRILVDNHKRPSTYWIGFWKKGGPR